ASNGPPPASPAPPGEALTSRAVTASTATASPASTATDRRSTASGHASGGRATATAPGPGDSTGRAGAVAEPARPRTHDLLTAAAASMAPTRATLATSSRP